MESKNYGEEKYVQTFIKVKQMGPKIELNY
jgi:hypothetical protein